MKIKGKNNLNDAYTNAYSPEELALNQQLYEECSKENIDYATVELLLKRGADPLGFVQDPV